MLYSIGHGDRSTADMLACLDAHAIEVVIDIRSWPRSRRFPQFDQETLAQALSANGIDYSGWGRTLGGRRRRAADAGERHPGLREPGLQAFADWMQTPRFTAASESLRSVARECRAALLCAERDPRQCHRWLLADHLEAVEDVSVTHLLAADGPPLPHCLTPCARLCGGVLRYDRGSTRSLLFQPPESP